MKLVDKKRGGIRVENFLLLFEVQLGKELFSLDRYSFSDFSGGLKVKYGIIRKRLVVLTLFGNYECIYSWIF